MCVVHPVKNCNILYLNESIFVWRVKTVKPDNLTYGFHFKFLHVSPDMNSCPHYMEIFARTRLAKCQEAADKHLGNPNFMEDCKSLLTSLLE